MKYFWLIFFICAGFYFMTWAFQSAWLSATPVIDPEIYKTRALILFPVSILTIGVGILIFVCMRRNKNTEDSESN